MAAIFEKFKGFLGMTDYDEYDDDVEYSFSRNETETKETSRSYASSVKNTEEYSEDSEPQRSGKSFASRLSSFSFGSSSRAEAKAEPVRREEPKRAIRSNTKEEARKMVNVGSSGMRVVLCKPTDFENCQTMCSHFRAQMTLVLNLEYVTNAADRRRIIDFISGCCYALDGNIQRVADLIYVVAPYSVDVYDECEKEKENAYDSYDYDSIY